MSCAPGCSVCVRLRESALEIVGQGGIDGLSLEALSERVCRPLEEVTAHYASAGDCLWSAYDEVSFGLFLDLAGGFAETVGWESGVALALRRLLARLETHPAEARLCFVEALRGDRSLRRRCDNTRQWVVEMFAAEHRRRRPDGGSDLQVELLVGAAVQAIARAIAERRQFELRALEPKLLDLLEVFTPVPA